MSGQYLHWLTSNLANIPAQLIYIWTKSSRKDLPLFRKAWNMTVYFYQIYIKMTSDCVSITKTLAKGVKLITGIKKYSHKK